jgi:hypothetical protein
MSKLGAMIVALVLFGAMPAAAAAQIQPGGGDTVASGNTQDGSISQGAQGGGAGGGDTDGDGDVDGGDAAGGDGNAGNQAAICQQNAGGNAN